MKIRSLFELKGMTMSQSLERKFDSGHSLYAWFEPNAPDVGSAAVCVHWRNPNGKPSHQPIKIGIETAESLFHMLSGFAAGFGTSNQFNTREYLERKFDSGYSFYAWLSLNDRHVGDDAICVHWRKPNNQPAAQPMKLQLDNAAPIFDLCSSFSKSLSSTIAVP